MPAIESCGIPDGASWLLLIYQLPARYSRARVQAWRRLQRLGAVGLKNSAYVLPDSAEAREDFAWIRNDINGLGGQAMVLFARAPDAATRDEIVAMFRSDRGRAFSALAREASALVGRASRSGPRASRRRQFVQAYRRLRERFDEAVRVDFFGTPERERVADLLIRLEKARREAPVKQTARPDVIKPEDYQHRLWVTRPRPGVDRMSSAWLIRRFVDPDAKFVFGDAAKMPDAIPFDTFDAEFGHHDGRCTYETVCRRFGIADRAASWIGRVVHDLDLKEDPRDVEATTVGRMVDGLRRTYQDDQALLSQGMAMFEALYRSVDAPPPRAGASAKGTRSRSAKTARRGAARRRSRS